MEFDKGETLVDLIGLTGIVIGIIGVAFGIKQYWDQCKAEKSLIRSEASLKLIRDKLQLAELDAASVHLALYEANETLTDMAKKSLTIAIPSFPFNLHDLVSLIDNARGELAISCDFIGYAMYSNSSKFPDYLSALQRAINQRVTIRLLLYGLDSARQAITKQLPASTYPEKRDSVFCRDYFRVWHEAAPVPDSYNEFRDTLLRDEEELIAKLPGVELRVIDHPLLTFTWIADQTQACIFAFRNDGEDEAGMSFFSKDKSIVTNFRNVFDSEWQRAAEPLYKGRW